MAYVKDKGGNPYKIKGTYISVDSGFALIEKDEWGVNAPPENLFTQAAVNSFFGKYLISAPIVNTPLTLTPDGEGKITLSGINFQYISAVYIERVSALFNIIDDKNLVITLPDVFTKVKGKSLNVLLKTPSGYNKLAHQIEL